MGSKPAASPPPKKQKGGPRPAPKASNPKPVVLPYASRSRPRRPEATRASADAQKPPPPPPPPLTRSRRIPLIGAGVMGAAIAFYFASVGYSMLHPYEPAHAVPADASDRFDRTAATYDADVGATERSTGLERLRRKLVGGRARGDVLEVSAGTGRNTPFYDWAKVRSLVLLDQSAPMLDVARAKWAELRRETDARNRRMVGVRERIGRVEFRAQSALDPIDGPPRPDGPGPGPGPGPAKFDTVVQTMGLCSTAQPEKLLQRMGEVVKEDGRILLLEHGRATHDWLNSFLDRAAPGHADKHGCWWNKDIGAIVERSGLEVVEISRPWYHFGTTWWIELRKSRKAPQVDAAPQQNPSGGGERRSWWQWW